MFNSLIAWFDSISIYSIIFGGIVLIFIEYILLKINVFTFKLRKSILINLWQFFGVLVPVLWLLRVSNGNLLTLAPIFMIIYFGIFKPLSLDKLEEENKITKL